MVSMYICTRCELTTVCFVVSVYSIPRPFELDQMQDWFEMGKLRHDHLVWYEINGEPQMTKTDASLVAQLKQGGGKKKGGKKKGAAPPPKKGARPPPSADVHHHGHRPKNLLPTPRPRPTNQTHRTGKSLGGVYWANLPGTTKTKC